MSSSTAYTRMIAISIAIDIAMAMTLSVALGGLLPLLLASRFAQDINVVLPFVPLGWNPLGSHLNPFGCHLVILDSHLAPSPPYPLLPFGSPSVLLGSSGPIPGPSGSAFRVFWLTRIELSNQS